jgi:hypothetical protein
MDGNMLLGMRTTWAGSIAAPLVYMSSKELDAQGLIQLKNNL